MIQKVVDHLSNKPEVLLEAAKVVGKGTIKRKVFDAIYFHKAKIKSVSEIMDAAGLERGQVLRAGKSLADHGLVVQTTKNNETAYAKENFFSQNKARVQALADSKDKQNKLQTKRSTTASFSKVKAVRSKEAVIHRGSRLGVKGQLRLAFLTTNPDPTASLRTDVEMRQVTQVLERSRNRDHVDIAHYPAAQFSDLLAAINEFKPNVLHFSGHGGAQAIVFDGGDLKHPEEVIIDYDDLRRTLTATASPPILLVHNACSTLTGAELLLHAVRFVVAMKDSIPDSTATAFSTQLYSALASGQPISKAVEQGRLAAKALGLPEPELPELLSADGHDGSETIL